MNLDPTINTHELPRNDIKIVKGRLLDVNELAVFELLRDIKDPEHPLTLEQLDVIKSDYIKVESVGYAGQGINVGYPMHFITISFKPTVPHCSMAGIIGLSIKFLLQTFISGYHLKVLILKDTHTNWESLSKQLNDKDRVLAASENSSLMTIIGECTAEVLNRYIVD